MKKFWLPLVLATAITSLIYVVAMAAAGPTKKQSVSNHGEDNLAVKYTELKLRLAEANLRKVERQNRRIRGAVPGDIVDEYREDVAVAKMRLAAAQRSDVDMQFGLDLRRAGAEAESAQARWESVVAATKRFPGTFSDLDIERYRLQAQIARVAVQQGEAIANASPELQMRWRLQLVEDQLQRLNQELFRNTGPGPRNNLWWY